MRMQFMATPAALLLLSLSSALALNASAEEMIKTDRYTLAEVTSQDDQRAPLTAIVTMFFGSDIHTVGGAITELLNGSGYRWEMNTEDQSLNALPLPSIVRTMGPIRLNQALATLAGKAWGLRIDELRRVVWFKVKESAQTTSAN